MRRLLALLTAIFVVGLGAPDAAAQHRLTIQQFGTRNADYVRGGAAGSAGNTFVVGSTYGTFPGNTSVGCEDAYVAKVTGSGVLAWARQFGTALQDVALTVAADDNGGAYVGGMVSQGISSGCGGEPADGFLLAYDSAGRVRWEVDLAGDDHDYVDAVAVLDGSVFVAATVGTTRVIARYTAGGALQWQTELATGFGEGQGMQSLSVDRTGVYTAATDYATSGVADAITRKHDIVDGTLIWESRWGTTGDRENTWAVAAAGSGVYVSGYSQASRPSGYFGTPFVARLDSANGDFKWKQELDRSDGVARAVAADEAGDAYVGGLVMTATRRGATPDAFLWKVSSGGSSVWLNRSTLSTSGADDVWSVSISGAEVTAAGETSGSFCKRCSVGGRDSFIAKFGTD